MNAAEYAARYIRSGQTCVRHAQYNKPVKIHVSFREPLSTVQYIFCPWPLSDWRPKWNCFIRDPGYWLPISLHVRC